MNLTAEGNILISDLNINIIETNSMLSRLVTQKLCNLRSHCKVNVIMQWIRLMLCS